MSDSGGEEVQLGDADDHTPHVHGEWRGAGGAKSRCQAIRTTSDTLLAGLVKRLPKEKDARSFIDLYERIHSLFEIRILRGAGQFRKLVAKHATFSKEVSGGGEAVDAAADELMDTVKDADAEGARDFVDIVHGIAMKSNFQVLSQDVFEFADKAEFECSIDQKMNPSRLDSSFFVHMHETDRFAADFAGSADICKHVLVYHRGIGSATKGGFFMVEKFDLILEWVGRFLVTILFSPIALARRLGLFGGPAKKQPSAATESTGDSTHADADVTSETDCQPSTSEDPDNAPDADDDGWVEELDQSRVSLEKVLWKNPVRLFTPITLTEPTFKEVMLVFRTEEEYEKAYTEHRHPQIQIALFRDIPIADFETILPAQQPLTRAFDIVKLLAVFVGVIMYMVRTVDEQLEEEDRSVEDIIEDLIPAFIGLVGYASKILLSWKKMQATYTATIMKFLQTYSLAKQQAVIPLLLNEMLAQELKEAILAYFFLWQSPNDTPELLDDECEHHLHSFHGETIDFDVKDALIKLKQLGIITYKDPLADSSELSYMPIGKAVRNMTDAVFQHMRTRERVCPYCAAGLCDHEEAH